MFLRCEQTYTEKAAAILDSLDNDQRDKLREFMNFFLTTTMANWIWKPPSEGGPSLILGQCIFDDGISKNELIQGLESLSRAWTLAATIMERQLFPLGSFPGFTQGE